jgi:hypothetical protein
MAPRLVVLALALLVTVTPPARAADEASVAGIIRVSPITVALELSASTVRVGQPVTALVTVTNHGTETVRSVTLSLRLEPVGLIQKGSTSSRLSQLKAGRSGEVSFKLCGATVASYLILAQAELDGATIESPARLLVVTEGRDGKC